MRNVGVGIRHDIVCRLGVQGYVEGLATRRFDRLLHSFVVKLKLTDYQVWRGASTQAFHGYEV